MLEGTKRKEKDAFFRPWPASELISKTSRPLDDGDTIGRTKRGIYRSRAVYLGENSRTSFNLVSVDEGESDYHYTFLILKPQIL